MFLILCVLCINVYAQKGGPKVTGIVQDEKGEVLPGVVVKAENKATGYSSAVATNENGLFAFAELPSGGPYSFTFTFIGLESQTFNNYQVKAGEKISLMVKMKESASQLKEVVVVGYGTQKKVNLTGAISQIDAKGIEDRPVANITQALQGAAPNVNVSFGDGRPGSQGKINVRGNTSINGGGEPLVLIDGVPGSINTINPKDVENISVLKDAASAAIYGARGAFGVVLVTTKQPKKGKLSINYSNNFGWTAPTVRTDFITDGYDAAMLNDQAFLRAVGNTYTGYTDEDYAELKKRKTDKSLPSVIIDNRKGKDQYVYYGSTDWWNTMFRNTQNSIEHSLNLSGGSEKIDFFLSGRMYEKNGIMRVNQDRYNTYNLRSKITGRLTDWLTVNNNTQYNASKYTYPGWGVNSNFVSVTVHALPSYLPVNPDGTATYRTELNNYTVGDGIYADLLHGKSKGGEENNEFVNTIGFSAKLAKGLELLGNYSFTYNPSSDFQRRTRAPWSIYPGVVDYIGFDQLGVTNYTRQSHVLNAYASYDKQVGKHLLKFMAGYNQELQSYKRMYGLRKDLLSEDLNDLTLGSGDQQVSGNANEWALQGVFSRVNYVFADKYLLEFNGRYDGTSKFPKGNRFGFFPSISGGWRVSEEQFFTQFRKVMNDLKIRASYGSLGNQQEAGIYGYIPLLGRGTLDYIMDGKKLEYLTVPAPISPNLTWEKSTSTNIGADIGMFNNRLTASFDWYIRNTKDMLIPGKTLPAVFGASSPRENAADMRTKGWELALNWKNRTTLANKPFSYNFGIGLSDYTATITRFDNPGNLLSNYYVGQQLGEIWGYSIDGYFRTDEEAAAYKIDQSYVNQQRLRAPGQWSKLLAGDMKFKDLNGDNMVNAGKNTLDDHGDLKVIGNSLPRYSFGITADANWGGFDLSVFFQGIGRQNWYPGTNADKFWGPYSRPYYSFIPKDFQDKVWSPENPNAYFPLLRGYEALNDRGELQVKNDRYIQDLAYIRMKNLTVGYTIPPSLLNKLKVSRCRLYLSGDNLFTFSKLNNDYIDPEQAASDYNGRTVDGNARVYPFSKVYSLGIDLSF
ncbi:SusC/RagA family TonB-linked outer membrane protein [Solitalea lacus]|uniref:SusC/RagA family TonB-linked outer membrane protein n=1 Tax=Solitalea lacus TaxID=2911172 RepID=UPI001EDAA43F|nr:TonB-dependent receptor [Solitalea lacus]UKJ06884.1 TonB-dependent receptor [Solitalea lacus]